jgi:hypothetical protein
MFLDGIWDQVVSLGGVIGGILLIGLVLFIVGYRGSADLEWTQKRFKFFGIFYNLTIRESLWLSSGLMRILFIAAIFVFRTRMEVAHTMLYLFLTAESVALIFSIGKMPIELVNCIAGYAVMTVANIIWGFYKEMYKSGGYQWVVVYVLLSVFAVLYTVYFYLKGVSDMLEWKIKRSRKMNEREYERELAERAVGR